MVQDHKGRTAKRKFCVILHGKQKEEREELIRTRSQMALLASEDNEDMLQLIRESIIGDDQHFTSPFGSRKITYCDYTASGRALSFIEDYIRAEVLPFYANTHTTTSVTGLQMTSFRHEARHLIKQAVGGGKQDKLIFTGSGSSAAINKLVRVLNLDRLQPQSDDDTAPKAVVFHGPYEHHSNILPWRESGAKVVAIAEDSTGQLDIADLERKLREHASVPMKIGSFSAASNVTGLLTDVNRVTALLHRHNALAFWDYAAAAPYVSIEMNPVVDGPDRELVYKDAVFISPHKFVGGVSTPGVLVAKKRLFARHGVPTEPAGGTVFFTTEKDHRYLKNIEEREEGGTPAIVESIRCGLVFQLKQAVGQALIERKEHDFAQRAIASLQQNPNIHVLGNTSPDVLRLPIISFVISTHQNKALHYNFVAALLNDLFGIQARGGCACAGPYVQSLLGISYTAAKQIEELLVADDDNACIRPGFVRVNFPYFMDEATFQFVLNAIHFVADEGWKLLPQYYFYPQTGEWIHRLKKKKFKIWRWLGDIMYVDGRMQYVKKDLEAEADAEAAATRMQSMTVTGSDASFAEYNRYIEEAESFVLKAVEEQRNGTVAKNNAALNVGATALLSEAAERLRWFLYPHEALAIIQGHQQQSPAAPIFIPKRYDASEAVSNVETTGASSSPPEPSTSTGEVCTMKRTSVKDILGIDEDSESKDTARDTELNVDSDHSGGGVALDNGSDESAESSTSASSATDAKRESRKKMEKLFPTVPKKLVVATKMAILEYNMIQDGDRVLVGLSGGKDSLTLLHVLHTLQKKLPIKFTIGAATVDPQTTAYDPSPLIGYMKSLGIPYFFESQAIIKRAEACEPDSICSWCSRMKRGSLYSAARRENYNVIALGQHLDDLAESFVMSAFHNGFLRTQKANYTVGDGDLRVIRPFIFVRERELRHFAYDVAKLPVINENCPACFDIPKERARTKTLLAQQESMYPSLYQSLLQAMRPLMTTDLEKYKKPQRRERNSSEGNNDNVTDESGST